MENLNENQLKEFAEKYQKSRNHMRQYAKKRHLNFKDDLNSEDLDKKKKAEDYMNKMKSNAKKHYHNKAKEKKNKIYHENKELYCARYRYAYYKKNNKMESFLNEKEFETIREILKNDNTIRKKANEKYPELF